MLFICRNSLVLTLFHLLYAVYLIRYVWNTFYLGLRLLVEARSVLNYNGNLG